MRDPSLTDEGNDQGCTPGPSESETQGKPVGNEFPLPSAGLVAIVGTNSHETLTFSPRLDGAGPRIDGGNG